MPYTRTNTQNVSLLGTDFEDTIQIVIRHNPLIDKGLLVQYQDQLYQIVNLSLDDSNQIVTYDILTLQINEVGKKHGYGRTIRRLNSENKALVPWAEELCHKPVPCFKEIS